MQTKTLTRMIGGLAGAAVVVVGLLAFTPSIGAAQDPGQAPSAGRMGGRGGPGGPGGPAGRMGGPMGPMGSAGPLNVDMRDLTDAQREQIRTINQRHAEEIGPLMERTQKAREALADAVFANSDLRGLSIELGQAEGELAFATAQIQTEVLNVLTPEQRQKIQERRKEMAARRAEMEKRRQSRGNQPGQ